MQSNYQKGGNYTTDLIHQDAQVSDSIPTSTSASTLYWNYNNPLTSTTNSIPAHGTPDKIGQRLDAPTNSDQIPIDINVSVDTSIVSGTYENQLLFSAVGNPTSVNYTITFNMAGGEPQIPRIEERSAAGVYTTTLPSTVPTKSGFQFRNWLSSADGKTYNPGGIIQIYSDEEFTGDVTLTAQYDPTYTYTLTYNCNGGTGCPTNTSFGPTIDTSHSFTIPSATITKTGYTFTDFKGSDGNNYNLGDNVTIPSTAPNFTLTAQYSVNQYTLTINPNGGTWSGSTSSQSFTQDYNTTKTIANPSANATYTISYNDNGQGATYTGSPTSVNRSFTGWDKAGSGEWNSNTKTYTYGAGDGSLTAQYNNTSDSFALPAISKTGHTCYWASDASGTKFGDGGESKTISSNITIFAYCTINQYTLTVNPNGGTWSGSTSPQSFTQDYNTTKTISNPTATPTYSITYDANGQGATYTASPTSVDRPFTSWSLSGAGSFAGGTYQFGAGNGTLTAQYDTTSSSFNLPAISKTGHICYWASNTTGTKYGDGGASKTITGNITIYAYCTAISYTVSVTNSNTTSGASSLSIPYGSSKTVTVTPSSGYYLSSVTCPSGYTCSGYSTGSTKTGTQTVTVKNNSYLGGGTLKFTGTALTLKQKCTNAGSNTTFAHAGTTYKKFSNGACYTYSRVAVLVNWYNAPSYCPSGTSIPSSTQLQSLVNYYGNSLYTATSGGWHNSDNADTAYIWSSTTSPSESNQAWYMYLTPSQVGVQWAFGFKDISTGSDGNWFGAVCIVN